MKNEHIITVVNDLLNQMSDTEKNKYYLGAVYGMLEELNTELYKTELKKNNGASFVKRSANLKKAMEKHNKYREYFQKAWHQDIKNETYQLAMINGYILFYLKKPLDVPTHEVNQGIIFDGERVYKDKKTMTVSAIDAADIRHSVKLYKASKSKNTCKYFINEKCYDAELLKLVFDVLGDDVTLYQDSNKFSGDIIENAEGVALIMPMRP